jgi:hypothetical protein
MKKISSIAAAISLAVGLSLAQAQAQAHEVTYHVTQSFNQVVYDGSHPAWDTFFTGTFDFNTHTGVVSKLQGTLTQAMSGNTTARLLTYQLSSVYDAALGGLAVTTFFQSSTDVFAGGGFAPGGMKEFGNQNAYATIFVNTTDPTAALTSAQIDKLAYADCTTGGLMGMTAGAKTCMTGWVNHAKSNLAGGTMQGTYPITQSITAVPEPGGLALALAGLGVAGGVFVRRRPQAR